MHAGYQQSSSSKHRQKNQQKRAWTRGHRVVTGLGIGLLGALTLALRWKKRYWAEKKIPETISPAVFATRALDTPFGKIVYHTAGQGAPLLFLHDVFVGASSFEWSKIYPTFSTRYQVLVPDLLGFGESQRPRSAISIKAQYQSLYAFLASIVPGFSSPPLHHRHRSAEASPYSAQQLPKCTIIASGLSANLALLLAAHYPNNFSKLLLWRPRFAFEKKLSFLYAPYFSYFPFLARFLYERYWSREPFLQKWLERSGYDLSDPSFGEILTIISATAQQYGAEHAFLAYCSTNFWQKEMSQIPSLTTPMTLLTDQEDQNEEGITPLPLYADEYSRIKVATKSPLAPLTHPQLLYEVIDAQLQKIDS